MVRVRAVNPADVSPRVRSAGPASSRRRRRCSLPRRARASAAGWVSGGA